ncbi:hypothetical protein Salat_2465700 [Sesamum alatum]|uniref:GRDP C2 domain-containing protein n=1 Tax=Sesamum alatum TaxID=300844 RepID=A0AAE2CBV3_9LAMI|nr:hypothetical protein Salat_2465700 [Sesamum alatum]
MYRGIGAPSPVRLAPYRRIVTKEVPTSDRKPENTTSYGKVLGVSTCRPVWEAAYLFLNWVLLAFQFTIPKSFQDYCTTSISLEDFMSPDSDLIVEKMAGLGAKFLTSWHPKTIGLRVAISVTIPTAHPAPYALHRIHSRPFFEKFLPPCPTTNEVQFAKSWTSVTDEAGKLPAQPYR